MCLKKWTQGGTSNSVRSTRLVEVSWDSHTEERKKKKPEWKLPRGAQAVHDSTTSLTREADEMCI